MKEFSAELFDFLFNKQGYLYICGDARVMAKDVHKTLVAIVMEYGRKSEEEAEKFFTELQVSGRYLTDIWF
jgi:NADPH-ferrihemoprotein reductase